MTVEAKTPPVSAHAFERARERLGLSRSAAQRLAARALERGVGQGDVSGNAKAFLDGHAIDHKTKPIVYGEFVFFFGAGDALVTVFEVPRDLRAAFTKALKRKQSHP